MYKTLSVGEVLWDVFPNYRKPGGSPANVAYHLHCLGCSSLLLSRVGKDSDGDELLEFIKNKGITIEHIQRDESLPTGIVTVEFNDGEPSYTIHEPSAWDEIRITDSLNDELNSLDAICFASLSQRNKTSANSIQKLLSSVKEDCLIVFDLNLRPPFVDKKMVLESIEHSDIIKINEHEYKTLSKWFNSDDFIEEIVRDYPTKTILLTEGEKGSSMATSAGWIKEEAHPITGDGDFVGVGDAFLACFTYLKIQQSPDDQILNLANQYAAYVASKKGGMPDIPDSIVKRINQKSF